MAKDLDIEQILVRILPSVGKLIDEKLGSLENRIAKLETAKNSSKINDNKITKFYFSGVNDGTFDNAKAVYEFIENESLYRFEQIPGEKKALVYVEDKRSVAQIFTANPDIQDSACERANKYNQNAIKIDTVKAGVAFLEPGNIWRIDKNNKVKISYVV